jgi:hypothetical protein
MQISWPENSCDLPARGTGFRLGWKVEPGTSLFAPWPEATCINPEKDGDVIAAVAQSSAPALITSGDRIEIGGTKVRLQARTEKQGKVFDELKKKFATQIKS